LTFYVPYNIPTYSNCALECAKALHSEVYGYFVFNEELAAIYKEYMDSLGLYNDNITAAGSPELDDITQGEVCGDSFGYVIYAPHWSITHKNNENSINTSTFPETGRLMLDYAKSHKEFNWVFKPHPTLKTALLRIGWEENKINDYYKEWESFAICCYDSNYKELFKKSKMMITDSCSFLIEYFFTNKPLVCLVSKYCTNIPYPYMRDVFNTFYNVYAPKELKNQLDDLLINNNDCKKEERSKVIKKFGLSEIPSSKRIINILEEILR